jgi:effector-binding domain-containing protein
MTNIKDNQLLEMTNVLFYRAKMTQQEINISISNIEPVLKENGANKNGYVTTSIFSIEIIDGRQVMDIEILVPIDKEIAAPSGYVFKKHFKLSNAVKIRHEGNPAFLQNSGATLMKYISDNGLTPITSGYNVTVKEPSSQMDIENMIVDIYVGVSSNIL